MPRTRLHRSSFVVAAIAAVWLVLVNVPGRVTVWQPTAFYNYEHGWPWIYLRRETLDASYGGSGSRAQYAYRRDALQNLPGPGVPWLRAGNWKFWEAVSDQDGWDDRAAWRWYWNGRILFANGAIAIAMLVGSVAIWEWRRRRRNGWLHFSLAEIFLLVTSVSAVLGWLVYMDRDFKLETRIEESSYMDDDSGWYVDDHRCIAPVWIRSLVGEKLLPEFTWRAAKVNLDLDADRPPEKICEAVYKLSYIHTVNVAAIFDDDPRFPFGQLSRLKRLRALEIEFDRPLDEHDVDELSQLRGLNVLALETEVSGESPAILARLNTELPGCRIVNMYEDEYHELFPDAFFYMPSAFVHPALPAQ